MRGVSFGDYHTGDDWGLILNEKSLTPPVAKTNYIQVEGRDGDLDFSESLTGEIRYNNRTASFTFLLTDGSYTDREELITEILGVIHGKKLEITLDDNSDYYLLGRCQVTERSNNKAYGVVKIECNCDPWFYKATQTTKTVAITSETVATSITLANGGYRTVSPDIVVTGSITLYYNNTSVALTAGTYKIPDLKLRAGNTVLSAKGSGSISFTYREGVL